MKKSRCEGTPGQRGRGGTEFGDGLDPSGPATFLVICRNRSVTVVQAASLRGNRAQK